MFEFGKKNTIVLPYSVYFNDDSIIIEAEGIYNEAFLVFHALITSEGQDLQRIYVKLNENIVKEIQLNIEYRDYQNFDYDFSSVLTKEEIDSIKVKDKKVLMEGTI